MGFAGGTGDASHFTLYGELETDRLISGFLTINVRKRGASGAEQPDDLKCDQRKKPTNYNWELEENMDASGDWLPGAPIPFDGDADNYQPQPEDQCIGDYHCFLFWVVGACHWHEARIPTYTADSLYMPGAQYEGFKKPVPDHPHCQSFIRAYPVALINPDTGTLLNHRVETIDGRTGVVISKLGNPSNGASMGYAQRRNEVDGTTTDPDTGALITSFDLDTSTSGFMDNWTWKSVAAQFGVHNGIGSSYKQPTGTPHPRYGMHDDGGTGDGISAGKGDVFSGLPDLAFNRTGKGNWGNNTGLTPNNGNGFASSYIVEPEGAHGSSGYDEPPSPFDDSYYRDTSNDPTSAGFGAGFGSSNSTDIDCTLRPPVAKVLIEGYHRFEWRDTGTVFQIAKHTPYCIKVELTLWNDSIDLDGNQWGQSNLSGGTQENDELGKAGQDEVIDASRNRNVDINISYMPFGETHKVYFTTTAPTGTTGTV